MGLIIIANTLFSNLIQKKYYRNVVFEEEVPEMKSLYGTFVASNSGQINFCTREANRIVLFL
jgi:hypothetical protein